jgi:hypothetical protein
VWDACVWDTSHLFGSTHNTEVRCLPASHTCRQCQLSASPQCKPLQSYNGGHGESLQKDVQADEKHLFRFSSLTEQACSFMAHWLAPCPASMCCHKPCDACVD